MAHRRTPARPRVAGPTLLAALAALGLAMPSAAARRIVEAGDLLVTAGDTVFVVRADGGGVAPFSPRDGSGPNQLFAPSGVVVDGARERVFATDYGGALLWIDPLDGAQTAVQNNLGGALPIGDLVSGIDALASGELLVGSIDVTSFPITIYDARIDFVSTPDDEARALAAPASEAVSGGPAAILLGLAVDEPTIGDRQLLVTAANGFASTLLSVSPAGVVTPVAGVPVQEGAIATEPDVDCSAGLASLCVRYWAEARIVEFECLPSYAAIFRSTFGGTGEIFGDTPLRCPLAVEAANGGNQVFVLDAEADFSDPRVYRLDRNPSTDTFTAVRIADDDELPDLHTSSLPGLAVSPVALPEPGAGASAAGAVAALAATAARVSAPRARGAGAGRRRRPSR